MELREKYKQALDKHLPEGTSTPIIDLIFEHKVSVTISRDRKTKHGDYRPPFRGQGHRISVNHTLNKYSFLITLVHELAHLTNWNRHRRKVLPHGDEWQREFKRLMQEHMNTSVFPQDVLVALKAHFESPNSVNSKTELSRVLKKYDAEKPGILIEEISEGTVFSIPGGRIFKKQDKLRKRYRCIELATNKSYLFSPLAQVVPLENTEYRSQN